MAARLFATKGYAATTTRELAAALEMAKGTFHHHYPSKEDLLVEICSESLRRMRSAAEEAAAAATDPLSKLTGIIEQHVHTMLADQPVHTTMLTELRSLSEPRYAEVVASRDAYSSIVASAIGECQRAGVLDANADTHLLTLLLLNMLNHTIFWYRPDGSHAPDEIAAASAATFIEGWRSRDAD